MDLVWICVIYGILGGCLVGCFVRYVLRWKFITGISKRVGAR